MKTSDHATSQATPGAGDLGDIIRRLDAISSYLFQLGRQTYLQYQTEAALLLAKILEDSRYDDPLRLERFGFKVYSQNEEDGILAEIFRRIGTTNKKFLEFGVANGLENNSRFLLEQGWSGAWLEGSEAHVSSIEKGFKHNIGDGHLRVGKAFVDRDNINELIRALALPRDLDLLGIDIDGNDYHVWEAITAVKPRVVVIEYNAKFRPPMRWVLDYNPTHRWDGSDQFGASLESLVDLGQRKGYRLVGCNITGTNAFFVKSELAKRDFAKKPEAFSLYQPARYFLTPAFISGHRPDYSRAAKL